jgi:hypothetical protein
MANPIEMNRRNWDERVAIHARDATGFYTLDRFRAGESPPAGDAHRQKRSRRMRYFERAAISQDPGFDLLMAPVSRG